ncbi:MAG: glycosyltransferase family 1 protein [Pyrinomonadaceae bacterium]
MKKTRHISDLVCFSHLRWDFVYQRPQHLLSRFARKYRTFYIEEPLFTNDGMRLEVCEREGGVRVVVPYLSENLRDDVSATETAQREMIRHFFDAQNISDFIAWYYTPMALGFTFDLQPDVIVYDCMDELSGFKNAPPALPEREQELFRRADLVFTGGQSLYEAKRMQHAAIYPFPSSIDRAHFAAARDITDEPEDQKMIPHPRLGFFGVVDERLDIELLGGIAQARPDWHFVIIGPIVKIDPATLPTDANIHYLGGKNYKELPAYLAGWDVALLLFAHNDSTRFISPTKTPEYLAAGKPVVSTSIHDVVRPYGVQNLVHIADTVEEFVAACEQALQTDEAEHQRRVDKFLERESWDETWARMSGLIEDSIEKKREAGTNNTTAQIELVMPENNIEDTGEIETVLHVNAAI